MHAAFPPTIDIEASGFGRGSYPIEIGYVLPDGSARCVLIRPAISWTHWDSTAEQMHGISRAVLLAHGRAVTEVALALNAALADLTVYCDGWAHDYAWLAALYEEAGLRPHFKLESVNRLLCETQLQQLDGLRRGALAEMGLLRHRASNDARALQLALTRVARVAPVAPVDHSAGLGSDAALRPAPARAPAAGAT